MWRASVREGKWRRATALICAPALLANVGPPTSAAVEQVLISTLFRDGKLNIGDGGMARATVQFMPDGNLLLGVPGEGVEPAAIFEVDARTGKMTRLAVGFGAKVSRDGKLLAYTSAAGRMEVRSLVGSIEAPLISIAAFPSQPARLGSSYYAWSGTDNTLGYVLFRSSVDQVARGVIRPRDAEIHLWNAGTSNDRKLLAIDNPPMAADPSGAQWWQDPVGGIGFSRLGSIVFTRGSSNPETGRDVDLWAIRPNGQATLVAAKISNSFGGANGLSVSDDGRYVGAIASTDPDYWAWTSNVSRGVFALDGSSRTIFGGPQPTGYTSMRWIAGSNRVLFACKPGAFANAICEGRPGQSNARVKFRPELYAEIRSFDISNDGKQLAWISYDRAGVARLMISAAGGKRRTLQLSRPAGFEHMRDEEVRTVRWKSFDGLQLEGVLILPSNFNRRRRVPLVVDVHGGPTGGIPMEGSLLNATPLETRIWTSRGYAVFLADTRKSQISTRDPAKLARMRDLAIDESDAKDVEAGIARIVSIGIADPQHVAAIGHSYGARIVAQLVTQSNVLAAAIIKEGDENYLPMIQAARGNPTLFRTFLETFSSNDQTIERWARASSPALQRRRMTTPVMIVLSGMGPTLLARREKQMAETAAAFRGNGSVVEELSLAPDYHVIMREDHVRTLVREATSWLDSYLRRPKLAATRMPH